MDTQEQWQGFADKLEWEGGDYILNDVSCTSDLIPDSVKEAHAKAQTAVRDFWARVAHHAAQHGVDVDV